MSESVTTELAQIWRFGNRRFLTKWSAYRKAAIASLMQDLGADTSCECESADPETRYPGSTCVMHDLDKSAIDQRARELMKAARS